MRREIRYTVQKEGRDKGKTFLITEFSARKGEQWAIKVFFALMNAGVEVPDGIEKMGMEAISATAFTTLISSLSRVPYAAAQPLIDEMLDCVQLMPDVSKPHYVRTLLENDIEEITTYLLLRKEVWTLNTDFFKAAAESNSSDSPAAVKNAST